MKYHTGSTLSPKCYSLLPYHLDSGNFTSHTRTLGAERGTKPESQQIQQLFIPRLHL